MAHRPDREQLNQGANKALRGANKALRVAIRGVVQGVGFRPFVYRLAQEHAIVGWVRNTSWGVEMEVEGQAGPLDRFVVGLRQEAPPLARIESLTTEEIPGGNGQSAERFEILHSEGQAGAYQLISPDIATCDDCRREIFDPADRRYRYPFTNCTNCGPRFTIIEGVPYDRPRTTMREFPMCPDCQREYDDPLDRRFHAQPNACPVCGPHVTLREPGSAELGAPLAERDEALRRVVERLLAGEIVAIKGLGGYQLACDATNAGTVARLRERKRRPHKPFAIMVADLAAAEVLADIGDEERALLTSTAAPIVLLHRRATEGGPALTPEVAPNTDILGIMLPYTPLHHLLLRDVGRPLVMTSGNLSEEPIARDNDEALRRLGADVAIADCFLTHNRGIYSRYDDSVWFVPDVGDGVGRPQPVRRARGHAPFPVRLPFEVRPILACGPELKNAFCLTRDRYAFLSQHIGDMENLETLQSYRATVELYEKLFDVEPEVVAVDMHPDYMATRYGLERAGERPVVRVQHHHAHLVSCLVDGDSKEGGSETRAPGEGAVIGVILDGTGYGLDGDGSDARIWGGEFLVGDGRGFERAAHLQYLPLPGGDSAVRRPYRLALAYLDALLGADAPTPETLRRVPPAERGALRRMVERGINTPLTSSAGRLFDAVSALLGVCGETSYEAQAAIELESAARRATSQRSPAELGRVAGGSLGTFGRWGEPYPYELRRGAERQRWGRPPLLAGDDRRAWEIDLQPLFAALLHDMAASRGATTAQMARRFHRTVADMIVRVCCLLRQETGLDHVALSGGCFQNRLLLEMTLPLLREAGLRPLLHRHAPTNDGGVALGQAVIAHYAMESEDVSPPPEGV